MTTMQNFWIGLCVVYVIMASLAGGFASASIILIGSIVCTAGIALAIWIPVCIGVGFVSVAVAKWASKTFGLSSPERAGGMSVNRGDNPASSDSPNALQPTLQNQLALEDYIRRAMLLDHSYEQIMSTLKFRGWSEAEIHQTYSNLQSQ
ncbi:MAG TPA: hypothetical protein V6C78_03485 [Crinalium sp.]|jgi:hypothetical protein